MVITDITQVGNPIIRKKSKVVKNVDSKEIVALIENLIDSMRAGALVGMAAPQIGINLRVFVTEIRSTDTRNEKKSDPVRVFINPKILSTSRKKVEIYEGCGSVACSGIFAPIKRSEVVSIEAVNEFGEKFILETGGLLARILLHEIDHLDGKIFLDHLTSTKGIMSRGEYMKKVGKA